MSLRGRRRIIVIVLLAAALTLGLALTLERDRPVLTAADLDRWDGSGLEVRFFDVGQADSILVRCGGEIMLVDGGRREDGPALLSALQELGVDRLDWAVCTHAHSDHAGGLSYLISRLPAERAAVPYTQSDNAWFNDFLAVAAESGTVRTLTAGDGFALGEASVQVLGPLREYEDLNDSSLVLRVVYGDTAILLTGDATWVAERDLAESGRELASDLLKAGHHGANGSTSYLFLREVDPEWAVISVGADNEYGHPGEYTLSRLADAGVKVLRTDELGTIVCRSDSRRLTLYGSRQP